MATYGTPRQSGIFGVVGGGIVDTMKFAGNCIAAIIRIPETFLGATAAAAGIGGVGLGIAGAVDAVGWAHIPFVGQMGMHIASSLAGFGVGGAVPTAGLVGAVGTLFAPMSGPLAGTMVTGAVVGSGTTTASGATLLTGAAASKAILAGGAAFTIAGSTIPFWAVAAGAVLAGALAIGLASVLYNKIAEGVVLQPLDYVGGVDR